MHFTQIIQTNIRFFLISIFLSSNIIAFENPYKDTPVNRVDSKVIKEFERFEFLESILSAANGSIYTTSHLDGKLYKIKDGNISVLMDIDGELLCLEFVDDNTMLVTGRNDKHEQLIFLVTDDGKSKIIATIPDAEFLNGITKLNNSVYLIADSYKGVIWKLDINDGSTSIWLEHDLFKRPSPEVKYPGINGIKIYQNTVYISNSTKALIAKIPILKNGNAGNPSLFIQGVMLDDFTLDKAGTIYAATHIFNSVIKITQTGEVSIIAQSDQGVSGSTSLTWKHDSDDTLLVSTNGGINSSFKSDVVPAKIVQLRIK